MIHNSGVKMVFLFFVMTWTVFLVAGATSVPKPACLPVCGNNETYSTCFYNCQNETCAAKDLRYSCPLQTAANCQEGCRCSPGYLRDGEKQCIKKEDCPNQCKNANEEYQQCGTSCPDTCSNYQNKGRICSRLCRPGCFCKPGYVRNEDEACVMPDKCKCGPNEIYMECNPTCPSDKCAYLGEILFCPFLNASLCKGGCRCIDPYYRDANNKCIERDQCPCKGDPNAIYRECPNPCEATCAAPAPAKCTKECVRAGCECREGFVLYNETGKCIKEEQCPKVCGKNETYSTCFYNCQNETCAAKDLRYSCPLQTAANCQEGCRCSPGYLRNGEKQCIKKEDCPPEPTVNQYDEE